MIGISMGDANGVGPEILLRAFAQDLLPRESLVFGDSSILQAYSDLLDLKISLHRVGSPLKLRRGSLNIRDSRILSNEELKPGKLCKRTGEAALDYIKQASLQALHGEVEAIVTLPVNKEAVRLGSPDFSGHTGYLARLCDCHNYTMMLVSDRLIVTHVSTHVSLREALDLVVKERILEVIRLTHDAVRKMRPRARIAVAGLNPHAGEHGAFGLEEIEEIAPAVAEASREGYEVSGPVAPDTIFHQAINGEFEAVVCMYHDQGHIPLKVLDFDGGVNVTLGLPFTRTSVDHGTAFDIAGKGIASLTSFVNACALALALTGRSGYPAGPGIESKRDSG